MEKTASNPKTTKQTTHTREKHADCKHSQKQNEAIRTNHLL